MDGFAAGLWQVGYGASRIYSMAKKRYVKKIIWDEILKDSKDSEHFEWLIIDSSYVKTHLAINDHDMPVKFIVTDWTRCDCKEAINLLKNLDAKLLFADHAYDTNETLSYIAKLI